MDLCILNQVPNYKLLFFGKWSENRFIFSGSMPFENYFFLEKATWDLFFPGEGPLKFFFSREAFWNLFFPGGGFEIFFSLYEPIKKLPKIFFFSHENFSGFIFSWGGHFEIYFFLGKAFWDLFFPGEGLLRFIFSWRRPSEILFFLDFLRPPQIINGRPLRYKLSYAKMVLVCQWLCHV